MPMYLKRDAIRFIEASVSAISMAVAALGMPRRYDFREVAAENAVAIGLAGVAAELSMSAVIVQAQGEDALKFPTGFYKTGSHIVDDFKKLVGSQIPKMMFLTQGIEEPSAHIAKLLEMASKLKLLTKLRAGGLHAGRGPSMDVSIACVNDVIAFISLLGASSRIKSYVDTLPKPIIITKSYDLIVDELIQKIAQSNTTLEKVSSLASVYLVIPELPDDEPEWFPAFERALVAPRENDISFLLDTLEKIEFFEDDLLMVKKILLLDYGGVLGYDHLLEQEELLANTVGLTQAELNNRISEKSVVGRDFRENKITEVEFWRIVSQNSTIDEHSANILTGMWMDTYSLNNSMMKYLQKLRQNIQIGILTNIDAGRSRLLEKILDIDTNLDYYFPSYVFGFSKDTAQLWDLVNRELATVNGSVNVIYVDDRAEHVLSAARIGWKGIRYYNLEQLKKQLDLLLEKL